MTVKTPTITKTTTFEAVPIGDMRLAASFSQFAPNGDTTRLEYVVLRTVIKVAGNKTEALHEPYAFAKTLERAEACAADMNKAIAHDDKFKRLADISESIIDQMLPDDEDERRDAIVADYQLRSNLETFEQISGKMVLPDDLDEDEEDDEEDEGVDDPNDIEGEDIDRDA